MTTQYTYTPSGHSPSVDANESWVWAGNLYVIIQRIIPVSLESSINGEKKAFISFHVAGGMVTQEAT